MRFQLEDFAEDVLAKAMAGKGIGPKGLAEEAGLDREVVDRALEGEFGDPDSLRAMARALDLAADPLLEIAQQAWSPEPHEVAGLRRFSTNFEEIMDVNSYLVWDPATRHAAAFDAGTDAGPMLTFLDREGLTLDAIFLTHTHADHVVALEKLARESGMPPVFTPHQEPFDGAEPFEQGRKFDVGGLTIESRLTSGHSVGGTTYVVEGLARTVAIVGDALFAGSMGGPKISYADALRTNRLHIFSLPGSTVLCPGHGPLTTVDEEKAHNPFFAHAHA